MSQKVAVHVMSEEDSERERALKGFPPQANHMYMQRQPNLSLFCKPKIMPLKSPNAQLMERLENEASVKEITVPDVLNDGE